ncbi:MAG: HEAT repeat domain-containing protein, partial [Deltaproteobacteria bacterium]|nr:HEAT repeat domain-containing protein [Deltaproteobacteria bacterium]
KRVIHFVTIWIVSGLLELPLWLSTRPKALLILSHFAATALLFFCEPNRKNEPERQRLWGRNGAVAIFFLSFFGWFAFGLLYFLHARRPFTSTATVEEEMNFLAGLPFATETSGKKKSRQEKILQELDFQPFSEILAGEEEDLKRGAVEQLTKLKTPGAIQLLQQYRSHNSIELRFYVTTALSKIKKDFEEQLAAAKNRLKKDRYKIASRLSMAESYLQYARSGLIDVTMAQGFIQEAMYHLQFSVMDESAPREVFALLIEIYSESRDWKKVLQVLDILEKRGKENLTEIIKIRSKALYHLEDFTALAHLLREARQKNILTPELQTASHWWTGA